MPDVCVEMTYNEIKDNERREMQDHTGEIFGGGGDVAEATQFLYTVQPTRPEMLTEGPTSAEQAIIAQHVAYLQQLTEHGVVLVAGRTLNTDASAFGIVILQAESEAMARDLMHRDPAVAGGVMRAELYPYRVAFMAQTPVS